MSLDKTAIDESAETSTPPSAYDVAAMHAYVVTHINEAVENGWIVPYYQPVVRTLTGKLCGFEALARWEDPTYGLMPPGVFIPALEETRVIHLLDCSIVRQVCKRYHECVLRNEPLVPISFNLSRLDFDLCDIFEEVENAAHEFGVPRRMLNIEITESVLGTDPAFMTAMMGKFRDAGYQVWMDDFGSGYSTLNVLKDFDFDELKIDMEFLSRFGEKSKTILASVVDMSKRLGIQTLAEGVETEEHRDYLRRIGCEKMQGYLFGKPQPYDSQTMIHFARTTGVESTAERLYLNKVGSVNTLSLSERDLTASNSTQEYVTSMPLATVEFSNNKFKIIDSNLVFEEGLENVGISSIEEAEQRINDLSRPMARQARRTIETIEVDKYARFDYVAGDVECIMRVKHITTQGEKTAILVSIDDTIEQRERKRHERMDNLLSVMYSIYDHVDVIHLDEGYLEPVFGNIGLHAQFEAKSFDGTTKHFAEAEIYARDRERYEQFMDHDTIMQRIAQSGRNYITDFFRLRQHGGDYDWKMFGLIKLSEKPSEVMYCIRSTNWSHNGLFQAAFDGSVNEHDPIPESADFTMTDASLWRALAQSRQMSLFWKDAERRFVGANQAFLDYYGFDSLNAIIGKTDEDMGWHIDPTPFMEDELRVLNEGASIENVAGQCIVRGEVRNIVANKRPVYRNGRIIGLVGFFVDIDAQQQNTDDIDGLPIRDSVTGVLNYTGLEAATWRFVDSYRRQGIDFAMVSINVESFERINDEFGYAFGDKVLKRVADELVSLAGNQRVVGHVYADRFVILAQNSTNEELQALCDTIEKKLLSIIEIDGTPCTIYALAGYSRFSQHGDLESMKRYNRDRRLERRNNWHGGPGDVITSTLL